MSVPPPSRTDMQPLAIDEGGEQTYPPGVGRMAGRSDDCNDRRESILEKDDEAFEENRERVDQGLNEDEHSDDVQTISSESQEDRNYPPGRQEIENRVMISAPSMRLQENIEKADAPIIETGAGVGVSNIQSQECTITKGRCTKHDILARKIVSNTKKWGKKKDGFGWIYRKSVSYKCMVKTEALVARDISTSTGSVEQNSD